MQYYFNVEPAKKERDCLIFLTSTVNNHWKEHRKDKRPLSKTFAYKVIFDLVEHEKGLDFVTRGWFKHGAIINCIPQETTTETKNKFSGLTEKIFKLCKEYDCNKNHYDWQFKQYKKFNNKLYTSMLNLKINLESNEPSEKSVRAALSDFYLNLFDSKDYDEVNDLIEEYISMSEKVLLSSANVELDSRRVFEFFTSVWNCFANFNYSNTVKGAKKDEIKKKALASYKSDFVNCKKEISDYLNEEINPSKEVLLQISTPLQKEISSGLQAFK